LLTQHPGNSVGNIGLSAPVGAHHGGNAFARKFQFRAITEGLESQDLQLLKFEQLPTPSGMAKWSHDCGWQVRFFSFRATGWSS
jgi:hypothetical protein